MTEQDLITKIQTLKDIKPRGDWALSVKDRIFDDHPYIINTYQPVSAMAILRSLIAQPRLSYVSFVLLFGIFIAAFGFANNALPGDLLYPFKKITEEGQSIFVLDNTEISKTQLTLLSKRLDELTEVAKKNKVRNLAPAINEVENGIAQAAKNLKKADANSAIIAEVKKIEDKKETIKSLGVEIGEVGELEWDAALVDKIKAQVDILSIEKLTEEQSVLLEEVKKDVDTENYVKAWEKVLLINGIVIE